MARLDEIAEGIATVLRSSSVPEPLPVDMRGQSLGEITFFVRAVIDSCHRHATAISLVRIGPALGAKVLKEYGDSENGYEGVKMLASSDLTSSVEFFRFPPVV